METVVEKSLGPFVAGVKTAKDNVKSRAAFVERSQAKSLS